MVREETVVTDGVVSLAVFMAVIRDHGGDGIGLGLECPRLHLECGGLLFTFLGGGEKDGLRSGFPSGWEIETHAALSRPLYVAVHRDRKGEGLSVERYDPGPRRYGDGNGRRDNERVENLAQASDALHGLHIAPNVNRDSLVAELGPRGERIGAGRLVQVTRVVNVVVRLLGIGAMEVRARCRRVFRHGDLEVEVDRLFRG